MCLIFITASVILSVYPVLFGEVFKLTRGLPREINHPVFGPGFAAIHGAMTLPVGRARGDPRRGGPRENVVPSLIFPLAVKIDGVAFKSSAPDQEATRRGRVWPRMFPLGGLRIEGAETEALDHRSLIGSLEEFQGNAAIEDLACCQRARSLAPGPIDQRKAADGAPLAFEKIKLPCLRVRGFGNHIVHTHLPKCSRRSLAVSQSRDLRLCLPRTSMRFIIFVFHPRVCRDPVDFPSLTSVFRKRLFKAARIRGDVRDNKSNENGAAVQCFLVDKLTASIVEFADRGLTQRTAVTVGKIEAPLVGFGIE